MTIERDDTRLAGPVSIVPTDLAPPLAALTRLDVGDEVGRFRVRRVIGEGGMGLVYLAEDPQLGRLVALKLLRPASGARAAEHQRRLLREAQVLARVAHRNLVTVFDVGVHGGVVFVAMEYVKGTTLDAWLKAKKRGWADILRTFIEAGQGLLAVHNAGLVHRDFKPGNVMVAEDHRVLILDFGLARPTAAERAEISEEARAEQDAHDELDASGEHVRPADDAVGTELTRAGGILGTPAYMAPEQHLGLAADPRTDQFGYCVALYEALYEERPFWGRDEFELMDAALRGLTKLPPPKDDLPLEVRRALLRGLSADRDNRYASMEELLVVLQNALGAAPPSRRWGLIVFGGGALVALTAGVTWTLAQDEDDPIEQRLIDPADAPVPVSATQPADDDDEDDTSGLPSINALPPPLGDDETDGESEDLAARPSDDLGSSGARNKAGLGPLPIAGSDPSAADDGSAALPNVGRDHEGDTGHHDERPPEPKDDGGSTPKPVEPSPPPPSDPAPEPDPS